MVSRGSSRSKYRPRLTPGCTVTATIPEDDPAYEWVKYYLLKHTLPITTRTSFIRDLWEALLPRGLAPPRKLTFVSRRPWSTVDDGSEARQPWYGGRASANELSERQLYVFADYSELRLRLYSPPRALLASAARGADI